MSKMLLIMKKTPLLLMLILALPICYADTIFLDNHPDVVNGSMTYEPATRTCGKGSCIVYTNVLDAAQVLSGGDTLYVRDGVYSRPSVGKYILVHGNEVNYWTGILDITASGTPEKHTVVRTYKNELVIIQAKEGVNHYNPDPADESFRKSSHYYPNPAIGIQGAYIDVIGFKTHGQVVTGGNQWTRYYAPRL